jgi:predicted ABC-type ATPase
MARLSNCLNIMEDIYASITKGVRKPKNPVALFLCGAAGTGKTTLRNQFLHDAGMTTTFVTLNVDMVREIVGDQPTARTVFNQLTDRAISDGYSILYDATCRDKSNIVVRMKELKHKGYKLVLGIVYATRKTMLGRIQRRIDQPLDESVAQDIYSHLSKNVETYMSLKDIDEVYLYNNETTAKLIFKRTAKKVYCISPTSAFYFDVSRYC